MKQGKSGKRNQSLNILQGMACICVVFIHIVFPGKTGAVVNRLSQFAVPLFYMISGFFAFSSEKENAKVIARRMKRILRITLLAIALYFGYTLLINVLSGDVFSYLKSFLNYKLWIKMLVLSDFDVINGAHLWFLPALFYGYIFLYFVEKFNLRKLTYYFLPLLFAAKVAMAVFARTYGLSWHYRGNFFFGALFWIVMGSYVAYKKDIFVKCKNVVLVAVTAVGLVFSEIFIFVDTTIDLAELGIIVYALALFVLAIKNPNTKKARALQWIGERYAIYVYIIHIIVASVINRLLKIVCVCPFTPWLLPIYTLAVSLILSSLLYIMNRKKRGLQN